MKRNAMKMTMSLVAAILLCFVMTLTVSASEEGAAGAVVEAVGNILDETVDKGIEAAKEKAGKAIDEMVGEEGKEEKVVATEKDEESEAGAVKESSAADKK